MSRNWKLRWKWMFIAPAAIVGILVFAAVASWIVQALWNWLMPGLFGLREITGVQALGLLALCRILFGGSRWHRGSLRSNMRRHMEKRCEGMTPEEREQFRQRMRERWGFSAPAEEGKES